MSAEFITVTGVVQGVGFRPFVYGLAQRLGVRGWVRNTSAGVEVHAEGEARLLDAFARGLREEAPPRAYVATVTRAAAAHEGHDGFVIVESAPDPDAYQLVSPDIATCDDCRRELLDPSDRRYEYPFTNCTNCGPRFTIIEGLPYDRERTTMRRFPLCPACRAEYEDPSDRRFHAEPNACPVCGPRVRLVRRRDGEAAELAAGSEADPAAPIRAAAELLRDGEILAVKGLGGFHLACDATDGAVVRRLKQRKRRPDKPLAVMFRDLDQVRAHCRVGAEEAELLTSPEHPIVLLEWREVGGDGAVGSEVGEPGRAGPAKPRRRGADVGDRAAPGRPRSRRRPAVPGGDAPLHAAPRPAAARRRPAARHDQRQPRRGADRQGLGGGRQAGAHRRRLPAARPRDRGALRRLGGAGAPRASAPGPPLARLRARSRSPCRARSPRSWPAAPSSRTPSA